MALGLVFFPVFSLPVVLILLLIDVLRPVPTEEHRRWTRRLAALFLLDLLLAPAFVMAMLQERPAQGLSGPAAAVPESPRIGVFFGKETSGPRIAGVQAGWPADLAGIESGDRITAVDGVPVGTIEETQDAIRRGSRGAARRITLDRGGKTLEIDVVPWFPAAEGESGLFHPRPSGFDLKPLLRQPGWWAGAVGLALLSWFVARRRPGPRVRVWRGLAAAMLITTGGVVATAWALHRIQGGWSAGAVLLALSAQTLFMLAGAWAGARLCGAAEPIPDSGTPRWSVARTVLLGLFYHVTGLARISVAVLILSRLVHGGDGGPPETGLRQLQELARSGWGILLFALPVVLLGPIAEETLFRGFLLPRLVRAVGVPWALAVSSAFFGVVHTHLGVYVVVVAYLGWVFGWARLRSGGLVAPALLHILHNGAVTVLAFLR